MDQGVLQKEQTLKLKQAVSQTKSKRLWQKSLHTTQSSPVSDVQRTKNYFDTFPSSAPDLETTRTQNSHILQDNIQFQNGEMDIPTFDASLRDSQFWQAECEISSSWLNGLSQEAIMPQANYESGPNFYESVQYGSQHNNRFSQLPTNSDTNNEELGSSSVFQEYFSSNFGYSVHSAFQSTGQIVSTLYSPADDSLFMDYLDHVFHIQYPFYHSSRGKGTGWLFSILTRAKSAYHATLALSECYQHRTSHQNTSLANSSDYLLAQGGHYDLALQEMKLILEESHTWSETVVLTRSIHILTCILQLLFQEVRHKTSVHILDAKW